MLSTNNIKKPIKVRLFYLIILILSSLSTLAQKKEGLKSMESEANKLFVAEDYYNALPVYLVLDSLKGNDPLINARVGVCFINTNTKYRALPYLEKAKKLGYSKDGIDYYLGKAYHLNHKFDKAIVAYQDYKVIISKGPLKDKAKLKEMDLLIKNCYSGKEIIKNPVEAIIENLGSTVNSSFADYAPIISGDEKILIFTSKRPNSGKRDENGGYFEDIYVSHKEYGKWTSPKNMGSIVNTAVNDASVGISVDGQHLFLYKNDTLNDETGGDIFESKLKNHHWSKPIRMSNSINSEFWEPSATMNASEDIFFFTSDRPDGYGGTDIYVCKKLDNNTWGPAKNLGPNVNSEEDEDAPFIHADGKTLYFISKGHNSMGGFDIFTSSYNAETDEVTPANNIGYPINTADEELFFVWSADGKRGYFSSAREDSYGEEDIYIIRRPNAKVNLILTNGKFSSGEESVTSSIKVINNETGKTVAFYDTSKFNKEYTIVLEPGKNYGLFYESNNLLTHSENIHLPNGFYKLKRNVGFKPLEEESLVLLNNSFFDSLQTQLRPESNPEMEQYGTFFKEKSNYVIEIAGHFASTSNSDENLKISKERAEAVKEALILQGISVNKIRAVGYGEKLRLSDTTNAINNRMELIIVQKLSPGKQPDLAGTYYGDLENQKNQKTELMAIRRAEVVRSMIEEKEDQANFLGIPFKPTLLEIPKKSQPKKVSNKPLFAQGMVDSEANIVTELTGPAGFVTEAVIEGTVIDISTGKSIGANIQLTDENGEIIQEIKNAPEGKFSFVTTIESATEFTVSAEKEGFSFNSMKVKASSKNKERIVLAKDIYLKALHVGTKFLLKSIYYDFNQSNLKSESFKELAKLEHILNENPHLKIEIVGHTDSHGGTYYNKILSQKRAEAVIKYLTSKGISKERLVALGMGEEQPLASNDDEEEGRELNRRTEILILKE